METKRKALGKGLEQLFSNERIDFDNFEKGLVEEAKPNEIVEISLDEIRSRVNDPDWWYATRAMSAFALVVAEAIGAKYIVPTDIAMVYGILDKGEI